MKESIYTFDAYDHLQDAHAYFKMNHDIDYADRILLKLMAATPEFHTSNTGNLPWTLF